MKKIILVALIFIIVACDNGSEKNDKLKVVTTTSMLTDLVNNIGGDLIEVNGLMGAGVDPHLYKASEGDVSKLYNADVIFYNGLHLEGKLVEVFEKMGSLQKSTVGLGDSLDKKDKF